MYSVSDYSVTTAEFVKRESFFKGISIAWTARRERTLIKRCAPSKQVAEILLQLPIGLIKFWRENAKEEFPGIPTTAKFFFKAAAGLILYFKCVEMAKEDQTLLPSKAADSIWHAWLDYDERSLTEFCQRNYNRKILHVPTAEMQTNVEDSLIRTYVLSCILDGVDIGSGYVPALFRLDKTLKMPHGEFRMRWV